MTNYNAVPSSSSEPKESDAVPTLGPHRILVLESGRAARNYWSDLWFYRELFIVLARRDISVRYKQSVLGIAWAVIRPFITMVVFSLIFGSIGKMPSPGEVPYPLMVFAGMLPWFLFSTILGDASQSLVNNAHLISKVYFPRLVNPFASSVVALVDFAVSLFVLVLVMVIYAYSRDWRVLTLPAFVILALMAAIGPAILFAALNVRYRDFRFIVPFIIQFGLYVSPVGFSTEVVPERWAWVYGLNPMVAVIEGFRWALLRGHGNLSLSVMPGLAVAAFALLIGISFFRRTERTFADII